MEFNKIYHGNCLELIKELPDNSIDFILTDPPYFSDLKTTFSYDYLKMREMRGSKLSGLDKRIRQNHKKVTTINSDLKPQDWFSEALRVMKKTNMIVWLDDRVQLFDYLLEIKNYGLKYYLLVWQKNNPTPYNHIYLKDKEVALYIYKDSPVDCSDEWEHKRTVISRNANSGTQKSGDFISWHPTPKPMSIIKQWIEKHSKKGDVVLDLFSGSGTTCVAAKQLGRQFIGFELDETYYKKSVERLESEGSQGMFDFEE